MQDHIIRTIDINAKIPDVVVMQYDNLSRYLQIRLLDRDLGEEAPFQLTGCHARLYIQPDGENAGDSEAALVNGSVENAENGVVSFLLPGSVTQRAGDYVCEFRLSSAANGAVISGRQFKLKVKPSIRSDETMEATEQYSALEEALQFVDGWDDTIRDVKRQIGARHMTLECLGDSYVDHRAADKCWSCQGFAADDNFFYIYRVGREGGHLQKLYRAESESGGQLIPALATAAERDVNLQHGNDMTVVTIDGVNYLLAVAGNNLANNASHLGAWLLSTEDLSVVRSFTLSVEEDGGEQAVYRVAAVKGTDEIYFSHTNRVYKGVVSLGGVTVTETVGAVCHVNQGFDYDNGCLYGLDSNARAMEIVDLNENRNYFVRLDCLMQGYILAEAESLAVFGDDVYIAGGTNANENVGISQTVLCHGNLRSQVKQFSRKANVRNLDEPIALYAVCDSDDGDYGFACRDGFGGTPFTSVYTAWLAAKSLFLLGLGVRFNIHVNVPIAKNVYLRDGGFTVTLTSDIQGEHPASSESKLVLYDVRGTVNLGVPLLETHGGQINLTGAVTNIQASDGAVIFYNSTRELVTADGSSNFLIVGKNKLFARYGSVAFTPYGS